MHQSPREKRKSQTRDALAQAAVEILSAEGIDALTADRIAEVAGVSRRTLFNYFARVEDIVTASIESATSETMDAIAARPSGESLRDSAFAVIEDLFDSPVFAQVRELERAAERSPATRRFLLEFDDRQRQALEDGLRRRLGDAADPVYVASLAAASFGVLCTVTRMAVAASVDDEHASELNQAWVRRGLEHLFAGFDETAALAAGGPATTPTAPDQES